MQIEKVYNNNVVQAVDQQGRELIVMGKGLGFQKKVGDELDSQQIEKIFVLQNDNQESTLSSFYAQLNPKELEVIHQIISQAERVLEVQFDLSLYLALTDHLQFVFQRCREGLRIENPLSWEIRKFYPKEYQLGIKAVQYILEELEIDLGKGEAASIALHFINGQKNGVLGEQTQLISKIVTHILDIVRLHVGHPAYEEDVSYHRFVTHVQYFAQRVANGLVEGNNDAFLYEQVKLNYPDSFACTRKIRNYISQVHQFEMSKDEQVYLTIHIQRLKTS